MTENTQNIRARFYAREHTISMNAAYGRAVVTLTWSRDHGEEEGIHDARTLAVNLDDVIKDGMHEFYVRTEADGLDAEIEQLYCDSEERPDDN